LGSRQPAPSATSHKAQCYFELKRLVIETKTNRIEPATAEKHLRKRCRKQFEAYTGSFAGLELTVERIVGGWIGLVAASHCVPVRVTDELPDLGVAFVLTGAKHSG